MANNKQRGLGRDLASLLGRKHFVATDTATTAEPTSERVSVDAAVTTHAPSNSGSSNDELRKLPVDVLQPGRYQPRQVMEPEALEELAASIRVQGVIQPIIVRPISDRKYEIIAGERRWRAAQLAGLTEIPAVVRNFNDETASAVALIENVQREDLNPLEQAIAYHRLTEEFGLTHKEVANFVGKSRDAISNLLRLLQLHSEVKRYLENGDLEMGHARALLSLEGHQQLEAAREVVAKNLSARETENLVRRLQKGISAKNKSAETATMDRNIQYLENSLAEKLGAKVSILHQAKGNGKLQIDYTTLEELEGILEHIQ
jgi:ParB family chromosome partitioning protein